MRRIEVDEDVYGELERHVKGFEHPNDVLRRLLLPEEAAHADGAPQTPQTGKLWPLIVAGLIAPGDELVHDRPRKGDHFEATVAEGGWISVGGVLFQTPSRALVELVGSQIDGWANWTHKPSGKKLRRIRWELQQSTTPAA